MNEKKRVHKQDRIKRLQELLTDVSEIKRKDVCEKLDISAATLSTMPKELRAAGWEIASPPRSGKLIPMTVPQNYEPLSSKDVRWWLVILLFQRFGLKSGTHRYTLSFAELTAAAASFVSGEDFRTLLNDKLCQRYTNHEISTTLAETLEHSFSVYTMRTDLLRLMKSGYAVRLHTAAGEERYTLTDAAPKFLVTDEAVIKDFRADYVYLHNVTQLDDEIDSVYRFVSLLLSEKAVISGRIVRGRKTQITEEVRERIGYFQCFPYRERMLRITYIDRDHNTVCCDFATGLAVYSIEKNMFYLIGKVQDEDRIIRFESIKKIESTSFRNTHFHSREYLKMLDEMFSVSTEEPVHAAVRFKCFGNIPYRVRKLHQIRPCSVLVEDSIKGEMRYEDDIRGIGDFARYLRSFGSSVIVEAPVALRNQMIASYRRIVQAYEEGEQ